MAVESRAGPTEFSVWGGPDTLETGQEGAERCVAPAHAVDVPRARGAAAPLFGIEPGRPNFFDARYGATGGVVDALSVFP